MKKAGSNNDRMKSRFPRAFAALVFLVTLAALAITAGPLHAVGEGRILGTVVDASGAPVANAAVVLSRPGATYKQEKKSDAKGSFTLLVLDATKEYQIHVEKEGFIPVDEPVK